MIRDAVDGKVETVKLSNNLQLRQKMVRSKNTQKSKEGSQKSARKNLTKFNSRDNSLHEIRPFNDSAKSRIPKQAFTSIVNEIFHDFSTKGFLLNFQVGALLALQESAEAFVMQLIEEGVFYPNRANRSNIIRKDMELARRIRGKI